MGSIWAMAGGELPRAGALGRGRRWQQGRRRCTPHGGGEGVAAQAQCPRWRAPRRARLPFSASARGRSLRRRDHSAPHQPARVSSNSPSPRRFFPPPRRPCPSLALTQHRLPLPAALQSRWVAGLGRGLRGDEGLPPLRLRSVEIGGRGLSEPGYPSAAATRTHVTRPPPRLPPAAGGRCGPGGAVPPPASHGPPELPPFPAAGVEVPGVMLPSEEKGGVSQALPLRAQVVGAAGLAPAAAAGSAQSGPRVDTGSSRPQRPWTAMAPLGAPGQLGSPVGSAGALARLGAHGPEPPIAPQRPAPGSCELYGCLSVVFEKPPCCSALLDF